MWRAPGMLDLAVLSVFGFSGYAALLATAPLWAVNGGATAAGAGLVNGVLLAATVLAQLAVPRALATWGTGRVLVAGLLLLVLQRQLWGDGAAGTVVGVAGLALASPAPPGPASGVLRVRGGRRGQGGQQAAQLGDGERDHLAVAGAGPPFSAAARVTVR